MQNKDEKKLINKSEMLKNAMEVIDDYLNAGFKEERKKASEKAKVLYKEYYGKDYKNRIER